MISTSGKKLYWSHAKVMIISEDIAKEGIVSIIDWVSRDSEVREDIWTLVTHGQPAYSIFDTPPKMESIISLQLNNTLRAEKSISRYPSIEMWKFIDNMSSEGISAVLPVVVSNVENGEKVLKVLGAGLFKKDRLIGYIDENMTKDLLWLRNELKGGLYNVKDENGNITTLEIHNSKTKLKPKIEDGQILINAGITINVDIAELSGSVNYIDENGRKKLENDAEKQIKSDVENTVKFIQKEYDADAFGFGSIIKIKNNSYWKKMSSEWDNIYPEIEVQVVPDVIIRGSATRKLPIKVGD
jgi:spore germination protein KC